MYHHELLLFLLAFTTALKNRDISSLQRLMFVTFDIYGKNEITDIITYFCKCEQTQFNYGITEDDIRFLGEHSEAIFNVDNRDEQVDDDLVVLRIFSNGITLGEIVKRLEDCGLQLGEHYSYLGEGNIAIKRDNVAKLVTTLS